MSEAEAADMEPQVVMVHPKRVTVHVLDLRINPTAIVIYLGGLIILGLCVMMFTINGNVNDVVDRQATSKDAGDRGRAALCQVLVDLGDDTAQQAACTDPAVAALIVQRPPTAGANSPGQIANRELLCSILRQLGGSSDKCS